jgi:hypothetical protein
MKAFPTNKTLMLQDDNEKMYLQSFENLGMDLRDYFAAKAMQAIIGKSDDASLNIDEIDNWIGSYAYVVADAMMEERDK